MPTLSGTCTLAASLPSLALWIDRKTSSMFWFANERDAPDVVAQSTLVPAEWRILELPQGDRFLMAILSNGAVRSTSPIVSAIRDTPGVITSSGRAYLLTQAPATDPEAMLKLLGNAARVGLSNAIDVSEQVWAELCAVHGVAGSGKAADAVGSIDAG